jgi:hypothetical protein
MDSPAYGLVFYKKVFICSFQTFRKKRLWTVWYLPDPKNVMDNKYGFFIGWARERFIRQSKLRVTREYKSMLPFWRLLTGACYRARTVDSCWYSSLVCFKMGRSDLRPQLCIGHRSRRARWDMSWMERVKDSHSQLRPLLSRRSREKLPICGKELGVPQ